MMRGLVLLVSVAVRVHGEEEHLPQELSMSSKSVQSLKSPAILFPTESRSFLEDAPLYGHQVPEDTLIPVFENPAGTEAHEEELERDVEHWTLKKQESTKMEVPDSTIDEDKLLNKGASYLMDAEDFMLFPSNWTSRPEPWGSNEHKVPEDTLIPVFENPAGTEAHEKELERDVEYWTLKKQASTKVEVPEAKLIPVFEIPAGTEAHEKELEREVEHIATLKKQESTKVEVPDSTIDEDKLSNKASYLMDAEEKSADEQVP